MLAKIGRPVVTGGVGPHRGCCAKTHAERRPRIHFVFNNFQPFGVSLLFGYFERKYWVGETNEFFLLDTCLQKWVALLHKTKSTLNNFRDRRMFQSQNAHNIKRRVLVRKPKRPFKYPQVT
jgi:hypothetical protein